ncbi:transcriptional regulator, TetR family [Anaerosphaera aminiphila DSM 21120]|uniref:Transcriptional regulator, TetR family n=1 Tax=Anaerosphaera aminiphila DSM 21120 TaxID=1120995 RepID=A0A1M5TD05_9FIRM|nr:TetR/AcrR family transcriptional regulator [Anaerosphaera aminiphila]SHH48599.1 transcriptional regulator, TetR family [Anaerosphaera aminiphila DSM 21120]
MKIENVDLRVQKTKRALATSMFTLLEKNSFGKITVNDICTEAMVSRSAFYDHFNDKYDLVIFCVELMREKLFAETFEELDGIEHRISSVLKNIKENVKLFKNLLMEDVDSELIKMMRNSFQEDIEKTIKRKNLKDEELLAPVELISTFYAFGITSVIVDWVSSEMKYSIEDMAKYLHNLTSKGVLDSVN